MEIMDINFDGFEGRKEPLEKIGRFRVYSPMFYRPSVFFHSVKLFHLVQAALPRVVEVFGDSFDANKALVMALIHDDAEIITGDLQSGHRAKLSEIKLQQVAQNEETAIDELAARFPKEINGYNYRDLLLEVSRKDTLESQVVKYLDHLDGFGEAAHEIYAGNKTFVTPIIDSKLGQIELPCEYYIVRFNDYKKNYPLLSGLMSAQPPFFKTHAPLDAETIIKNGRLHTLENLTEQTGNAVYDWWKKVLLESLTAEELENLYVRKENLKQ